MAKFRIKLRTADSEEWWEDYNLPTVDNPRQWATQTIADFNRTLRSGETARILLDVELNGGNEPLPHVWVKRTGGMSKAIGDSTVDLMFCSTCGISGKRYGLSVAVQIDSKYRKWRLKGCANKWVANA